MRRMLQLGKSSRYNTKSVSPAAGRADAPFQLPCSITPIGGCCFRGDSVSGWYEGTAGTRSSVMAAGEMMAGTILEAEPTLTSDTASPTNSDVRGPSERPAAKPRNSTKQ